MKRISILFLVLLIFTVSTAWAGKGGSSYSRYGIGDIRYSFSDISQGIGNSGLAIISASTISSLNPAGISDIYRTRFSLGFRYEGYKASDEANSVYLSGTRFDQFLLAIPLYTPSGIVFSTGITPYSTGNYDIKNTSQFGSLLYEARFTGEGGLSEGHIASSWTPTKDLSLGIKGSYYFGTIRHTVGQAFNNADYSDAQDIRSTQVRGIGGTLGIIYKGLGKALELDTTRSLTLGLILGTSARLRADEEHYLSYTASSSAAATRDTVTLERKWLTLPVRIGFGAAYQTNSFLLAGDLLYQHWNNFSSSGSLTGEFRDSYRMSVGSEIFPRRDASASGFQRWAYRFGLFYDASYYRVMGKSIDEFGGTIGFGIPVFGETRLNVAGEYSIRGTTDLGLQKDNIFRLILNFSVAERWFIPVEEE